MDWHCSGHRQLAAQHSMQKLKLKHFRSSVFLRRLNQHIAPWAALLFYGSWTAGICLHQGLEYWYFNALIHGSYAFVLTIASRHMTLFVKHFLQRLFSFNARPAALITYAGMTIMLIILPAMIQQQLQNNAVLMTILPGILAGQFYLMTVLFEA